MNHKNEIYPCDIIRDLLPGYIDEILSETGTRAVCSHLEHCTECQSIYEAMKETLEDPAAVPAPEEQAALDGFRKFNRHARRLKLAVLTVSGLLAAVLLFTFLFLFVIGSPTATSALNITDISYDMEAESLTITGAGSNDSFHVSRVVVRESNTDADTMNILVYETEKLPFLPVKNNFSVTIPNVKGQTVYLACPEYDRMQLFSWKNANYEKLDTLKNEIYRRIPQLDKECDILSYSANRTVDGVDGIFYSVDYLTGDNATYWRFDDQIITDGELVPAGFTVWISEEEPYQVKIYDYQTGELSEDYSVVSDRRPAM